MQILPLKKTQSEYICHPRNEDMLYEDTIVRQSHSENHSTDEYTESNHDRNIVVNT